MKIILFFYALFENITLAIKNITSPSEKLYFIYLYIFLKFKRLLIYDILRIKSGSLKILSHRVYFPDYELFEMMFIDVFLKRIEYLETKNSAPVIFDCGANIGLSVFYLKVRYPNAKITCFEPSSDAYQYLKKNLSYFNGCKLVKAAVSGKNTKWANLSSPLNAAPADLSSSISSGISEIRWKDIKVKKEKVKTVRLSSYIQKGQTIDFLNLDIEGLEEDVLQDLKKTARLKQVKEMFVEYHHTKNTSFITILDLLTKSGFKIIPGGDVRPPLPRYKDQFYIAYFWAYKNS